MQLTIGVRAFVRRLVRRDTQGRWLLTVLEAACAPLASRTWTWHHLHLMPRASN
jgi:hypothetical protein